jgi:hypothetical protein
MTIMHPDLQTAKIRVLLDHIHILFMSGTNAVQTLVYNCGSLDIYGMYICCPDLYSRFYLQNVMRN